MERYSGRDAYLDAIRQAAASLTSLGYLLKEDIPICVEIAAERYDAVLQAHSTN